MSRYSSGSGNNARQAYLSNLAHSVPFTTADLMDAYGTYPPASPPAPQIGALPDAAAPPIGDDAIEVIPATNENNRNNNGSIGSSGLNRRRRRSAPEEPLVASSSRDGDILRYFPTAPAPAPTIDPVLVPHSLEGHPIDPNLAQERIKQANMLREQSDAREAIVANLASLRHKISNLEDQNRITTTGIEQYLAAGLPCKEMQTILADHQTSLFLLREDLLEQESLLAAIDVATGGSLAAQPPPLPLPSLGHSNVPPQLVILRPPSPSPPPSLLPPPPPNPVPGPIIEAIERPPLPPSVSGQPILPPPLPPPSSHPLVVHPAKVNFAVDDNDDIPEWVRKDYELASASTVGDMFVLHPAAKTTTTTKPAPLLSSTLFPSTWIANQSSSPLSSSHADDERGDQDSNYQVDEFDEDGVYPPWSDDESKAAYYASL